MADSVDEGGFWLPPEFFDDLLLENADSAKTLADWDSDFRFPSEFPYQLEIDRHLKRQWAATTSTSPQSTLVNGSIWLAGGSSNGSPNDGASPPTTPLSGGNDVVGDLINQAAGQVAKLKLNGGVGPGPTKHNTLPGPPKGPEQLYPSPLFIHNNNLLHKNKAKQQKQVWRSEPQMWQASRRAVVEVGRVACPFYPNPTGGAAAKNGRAGTGVFLPRRYGSNSNSESSNNTYASNSRKKTGYVPDRSVFALNRNLKNINGFAQSQTLCQPTTNNRGFASDYDLFMVRRNAVMLQHGLSMPMSHGGDFYLPQGWTY